MAQLDRFRPGDQFADKYEIRELIGRGGMGVVYRVWHQYLDREAALKLVPLMARSASVDLRERFKQETAAMGKLKHPNIVEVFDGGVVDSDTAYIAMELMHGKNLRQLFGYGPLQMSQLCLYLAQVSDALFCLHQNKILHRDIKPENIFVTKERQVKIIDFGLARIRVASKYATLNPRPVGTPQYMPPEQLMNTAIDESVDVYALGMVAWEAASGKHPFAVMTGQLPDREAATNRLLSGAPLPNLADERKDAPAALASLVAQCLEFESSKRPKARDVSMELRKIARALMEPPSVRPGAVMTAVTEELDPALPIPDPTYQAARRQNEAALSIEARLLAPPPQTVKLPAPQLSPGGDKPRQAGEPQLHTVELSKEFAPTAVPKARQLDVPAGKFEIAEAVGVTEPGIAPGVLPNQSPPVHVEIRAAAPLDIQVARPLPPTLQSNQSYEELAARNRMVAIGLASTDVEGLGAGLIGAKISPERSVPTHPEASFVHVRAADPEVAGVAAASGSSAPAAAALTVEFSAVGATGSGPTGAVQTAATTHAVEQAPFDRQMSRMDVPYTPGPVATARPAVATNTGRLRGLSFVAGLLTVGMVIATLFAMRVRDQVSVVACRSGLAKVSVQRTPSQEPQTSRAAESGLVAEASAANPVSSASAASAAKPAVAPSVGSRPWRTRPKAKTYLKPDSNGIVDPY